MSEQSQEILSETEIFMTLELGENTTESLKREINAGRKFRASDWGAPEDYMNQPGFETAGEPKKINLVKVSVDDLGFEEKVKYSRIVQRAQELGLDLVPAEVGPALRTAYTDQPFGEYLLVAHDPIKCPHTKDGNIFELKKSSYFSSGEEYLCTETHAVDAFEDSGFVPNTELSGRSYFFVFQKVGGHEV